MRRCYECCQENCHYHSRCSCDCHVEDVGEYALRNSPPYEKPKPPCKKHRTYKAIRKPTSGCEDCWRFYIKKHP